MLHVEHECEIETNREDIFLLPNRNFFQKAFDTFRSLLMASGKNPAAHKYLHSRDSIIMEKRRHLHNYKHILHPFSIFRYISLTNFYNFLIYVKFIMSKCIYISNILNYIFSKLKFYYYLHILTLRSYQR